jgi:hypothetical protein
MAMDITLGSAREERKWRSRHEHIPPSVEPIAVLTAERYR